MRQRKNDWIRVILLTGAAVTAALFPAMSALAQTQDAINATVTQQVIYLGQRLDKIDQMINAVLIALVLNFVAQVVNIKRGPGMRS